jgi:hypothetical protein
MEVLPGGPAFFADARVKDCIVKVGGQPVTTIAEYTGALSSAQPGDDVVFALRRGPAEIEVAVEIADDARDTSGFNLLGLVKYKNRPEGSHFSVLFELLLNRGSGFCVKRDGSSSRNVREYCWGAVLDLIHWHRVSGGKKELRLLWFFPISWG